MPTRLIPFFIALALALPALAAPPSAPAAPDPPKSEPAKKPEPKSAADTKPSAPTLKLGDKAPSFNLETIKGDLIPGIEPNKVYVVEFWATWCPSCREALPKLKKLSKSSKDLTIVAIASSERSPDKPVPPAPPPPDTRLDGVKRYANDHSAQMPYPIVFDGNRAIAADWLVAAHPSLPRYLPFAFVVDSTQTISWIGDPRKAEFDAAIEKALKPLAPPPPPPTTTDSKKPDRAKPRTTPKPKGG